MSIFKKYKYDKKKFDFLLLVEKFLSEKTGNKIKKLNDINQVYQSNEVNTISRLFYELFHKEVFTNLYNNFIKNVLEIHIDKEFVYQVIPSIRIAFPNSKSVNFHNDCWYGHGQDVQNIWVPLTNVRKTQSLAFLSEINNQKLLSFFHKKQPSLVEIQRHCEKKIEFAECNYGEFIIFPTKALHGTVVNVSDKIRVSFDFRICTNNDFGLKNPKFFRKIFNNDNKINSLRRDADKNKQLTAIGYLNQFSIYDNFKISQTIQHEAVTSFCLKNNLDLILLETELIGFTKPLNLEDILFGSRSGLAKDIVVFSDKLIFLENPLYFKLIKKSIAKNFRFHFVNEGYILDKFSSIRILKKS
jgi:sporadic carbohydrate cluster 2OG-Fe(II) oxygenase